MLFCYIDRPAVDIPAFMSTEELITNDELNIGMLAMAVGAASQFMCHFYLAKGTNQF